MVVTIDNKNYNVVIKDKEIKHGHMKVDIHNNIIISGYHVGEEAALKLIKDNLEWLRAAFKKNEKYNKNLNLDEVNNKEKVWLFGRCYDLVQTKNNDLNFKINDNILYHKGKFNVKKFQEHFMEIIRKRFDYFNNVFHKNADLEFKLMHSKYGYCKFNENLIVLSRNIVHLPGELIDYIIIHEFCHFKVHNHSKEFYDEVIKYCPDYKKRVKKLKEYAPLTRK